MSKELKYVFDTDDTPLELPFDMIFLFTPDGSRYRLEYNPFVKGIIIQKVNFGDDSTITIQPCVSNQIIIK